MGSSFNFTIPRFERPIADILARVPRAFRDQAEKGFVVLAKVSPQHYALILNAVIVTLESKKTPFESLEASLGISKNDLGHMFAAAMLTVPILGDGGTAEEFLGQAVKTRLIEQSLVPGLEPFINTIVSERSVISKAIRRSALPAQVFPYFSDIEIAVDLRMGFDGDEVAEAVPIALVHIDTDTSASEIWFQCSKQQMMQLKNDIDAAVKKMEAADTWGKREPAQ
jgi:hypothetical protein